MANWQIDHEIKTTNEWSKEMKKSEYELLANQWDDEAMETDEKVLKSLVLYEKDPSISAAYISFNSPSTS